MEARRYAVNLRRNHVAGEFSPGSKGKTDKIIMEEKMQLDLQGNGNMYEVTITKVLGI
ncbi:MAG: hypothetical protein M1151_02215 [Candidatus Thermoplasmatota archaeon]|jgi:hypothetical protein|nr:hypothetical protein [Candidatus Thermoplasmatota archaeon]